MCILDAKEFPVKPRIGYKIFRRLINGDIVSPVQRGHALGVNCWVRDEIGIACIKVSKLEAIRQGLGFHVFYNAEDAIPMLIELLNDTEEDIKFHSEFKGSELILKAISVRRVFAFGKNGYGQDDTDIPVFLCHEMKLGKEIDVCLAFESLKKKVEHDFLKDEEEESEEECEDEVDVEESEDDDECEDCDAIEGEEDW